MFKSAWSHNYSYGKTEMFFNINIAMLTRSLCRNKALRFLSHGNLWDKDKKLALMSYSRDLCLVSARILWCDRFFEMPLSHKTFSSLAVKSRKVYLSFKQYITVPCFSLFPNSELYSSLSPHCLTSFWFFLNFWNCLFISDKRLWTLCQLVPKT